MYAPVTGVLCDISCYIGQRYNGSWVYIVYNLLSNTYFENNGIISGHSYLQLILHEDELSHP